MLDITPANPLALVLLLHAVAIKLLSFLHDIRLLALQSRVVVDELHL